MPAQTNTAPGAAQTVLITGGGSGIGKELVTLFAKDGYFIVVFSLVQEELDQLASELTPQIGADRFKLFQADLSQPGAAQSVVDRCATEGLTIDVLVNNAGFALFGPHIEQNIARQNAMMQLNMVALTELSTLFGAQMKERGAGKILNIGSTMGIAPTPQGALYGATKAFVNSLSVALWAELKPYGVTVSCMEPYATKTKFFTAAGEHSVSANEQTMSVDEAEDKMKAHDASFVARCAYNGLKKNKAVILPGASFGFMSWVMRTLPPPTMANVFERALSKAF